MHHADDHGDVRQPRSLGYGVSALAALIIGVTFTIITFSVGPDGAPEVPPDGAKLVPFLFAFIPFGVAIRLFRNAWDECAHGEAAARMRGVAFAISSAAVAFFAAELFVGAGVVRMVTAIIPG